MIIEQNNLATIAIVIYTWWEQRSIVLELQQFLRRSSAIKSRPSAVGIYRNIISLKKGL